MADVRRQDKVDRDTVRNYLTEVYLGVPGLLQIWTDPRKGCGQFFATDEDGIEQAVDHVEGAYAFEGERSVYARVTTLTEIPPVNPENGKRGRGPESLSSCFMYLWTDLDFGTTGHAAKTLPPDADAAQAVYDASGLPPASITVNSGGGLYHIVMLDEPLDITDVNVRMRIKALSRRWQYRVLDTAEKMGYSYDAGVGDLARVLRIPGSVNAKDWSKRRLATHVSSGLRYTFEELEEVCPAPPKPAPRTFVTTGEPAKDARDRFEYHLAELRATTERRNDALNKIAYMCFQYAGAGQLDPSEVEREFITAGLDIGLEERETRATVNSAKTAGMAKPYVWRDFTRPESPEKTTPAPEDMWAGQLDDSGQVAPAIVQETPVQPVVEAGEAPPPPPPAPPAPPKAPEPEPSAALPFVDVTNERDGTLNLTSAVAEGRLPEVYVRDGQIVHVTKVSGTYTQKNLDSTHRAVVVDASYMRNMAATHLVTTKMNAKGQTVPTLPTKALCEAVLAKEHWPTVDRLRDVVGAPFVRADGTICQEEGYDKATAMWLALPPGLRHVPEKPSKEDVREALKLILDTVLRDFPWVSSADRANYVALLLTPMLRELVDCVTPLGLITAAAPSSGKSLLTDLIACTHGGRMTTLPKQDEELEKKITTFFASEMVPTVTFDNIGVGHTLNSPILAQLLTQRVWNGRILGRTESISRVNDKLWMVTGNNLQINNDMRSRSVLVHIDPRVERPEERDTSTFAVGNLDVWMRQPENKARVVWALLVMVRAWAAAGMPRSNDEMRTYTPWAKALGGLLAFHGIEGFRENQDELDDADEEKNDWSLFLSTWHQRHGDAWVTSAQVIADQQNTLFETGIGHVDPWQGTFPLGPNNKPITTKGLGKKLQYYRDRPSDGWVLRYQAKKGRAALWRVERMPEAPPPPTATPATVPEQRDTPRTVQDPIPNVAIPRNGTIAPQRSAEIRGNVNSLLRTLTTINPTRHRHDENRQ